MIRWQLSSSRIPHTASYDLVCLDQTTSNTYKTFYHPQFPTMLQADDNIPILIVGGGPSGLTLGYMLARLGGTYLIPLGSPEQ